MDTVMNQAQVQSLVQVPTSPIEPKEQLFKARFPDLYYEKSHLDCYRFCQQCEDHFDRARTNEENHTPFVASFLQDSISTR